MAKVPLAGTNYTVGQTEADILGEVRRLLSLKEEEELAAHHTENVEHLRALER